jgi:hypothetical protein
LLGKWTIFSPVNTAVLATAFDRHFKIVVENI